MSSEGTCFVSPSLGPWKASLCLLSHPLPAHHHHLPTAASPPGTIFSSPAPLITARRCAVVCCAHCCRPLLTAYYSFPVGYLVLLLCLLLCEQSLLSVWPALHLALLRRALSAKSQTNTCTDSHLQIILAFAIGTSIRLLHISKPHFTRPPSSPP